MRISKFFFVLETYAGFTSLFYLLLDFSLKMTEGSKLILSTIATLFTGPVTIYLIEFVYVWLKRNKYEGKRESRVYHKIHIGLMLVWIAVTIASVGFTRPRFHNAWIGSFILTVALDIFLFDFVILMFAMIKRNNSKFLALFKLKGFYIDVGPSAIMTPEDEAALIAKIKKSLYTDSEKVGINETSRALTFANSSRDPYRGNDMTEELNGNEVTIQKNHSSSEEQNEGEFRAIRLEDFKQERDEDDVFEFSSNKEEKSSNDTKEKIPTREKLQEKEKTKGKLERVSEIDDNTNISDLVKDIERIIKPQPKKNSMVVKDTYSTRSKSRFKKHL